jgi:hypothetical protein
MSGIGEEHLMQEHEGSGRGAVRERRVAPPDWWIGEGPEACPWCLQGYAVELERRCTACDRPGCYHCMVRVRVHRLPRVLCPECGAESGGSDAAASGGS